MLSVLEKQIAVENTKDYFSSTNGKILFKVLSNYLATTTDLKSQLQELDDNIFNNEQELIKYGEVMIKYIASVAMENKELITYTTGELSKYFGVSITTINNWIKEERFIGLIQKEKFKQSRINENILWKSSNGELISIKEIVKMYEEQNIKELSKKEEIEIIMSEIKYFEDKYNGNYENTLKEKADKNYEEQRDESEWRYLLNRINQ